uniref:Uncharacterized protein n=1 Tax=Photinus pyralis TaxID=7054 RepID=A0A1Y1MB44_PHOPY
MQQLKLAGSHFPINGSGMMQEFLHDPIGIGNIPQKRQELFDVDLSSSLSTPKIHTDLHSTHSTTTKNFIGMAKNSTEIDIKQTSVVYNASKKRFTYFYTFDKKHAIIKLARWTRP